MTPEQRLNLKRLLKPRHVAVIGGRDAITVAKECARSGYDGPFWPVNPKRDKIGGHPCYASVDDLPEPPDACFVAVPIAASIDSLAKLNAMGAGGAVVYTAGFGEVGAEGAQHEAALIKAAPELIAQTRDDETWRYMQAEAEAEGIGVLGCGEGVVFALTAVLAVIDR